MKRLQLRRRIPTEGTKLQKEKEGTKPQENDIAPQLYLSARKELPRNKLVSLPNEYQSIIREELDYPGEWSIMKPRKKNHTQKSLINEKGDILKLIAKSSKKFKVIFNHKFKKVDISPELIKLYFYINSDQIAKGYEFRFVDSKEDITIDVHTFPPYKKPYLLPLPKGYQVYYIKSPPGSGKSTLIVKDIINILKSNSKWRCCVYSCRISLSTTIDEKFGELISEEDKIMMENHLKYPSGTYIGDKNIIISPESDHKLMNYKNGKLGHYEILWLDEVKKLYSYYCESSTFKGNRLVSLKRFKQLVRKAKFIFLSDADLNDHVIEWIRKIRGHKKGEILIWNQMKTDNYEYKIHHSEGTTFDHLYNSFDLGEKVYIGVTSVGRGNSMYKFLVNQYPQKKFLLIKGEGVESTEYEHCRKREILKNCNEVWSQFDCVITTPCVIYGTDFDREHFDKVFYFWDGVLKGEYVYQALHRVRKIKSNQIHVYIKANTPPSQKLPDNLDDWMNSEVDLLYQLIPEARREEILSNINADFNDKDEYVLDREDLLYWMYLTNEVENAHAFSDIKEDILAHICKNREKGIWVQLEFEEPQSTSTMDNKNPGTFDITCVQDVDLESYKKLKIITDPTKYESLTIERNRLRFKYGFSNMSNELLYAISDFDENRSGLVEYLQSSPIKKVNDVTEVTTSMLIEKTVKLLRMIGFTDGLFSTQVISSVDQIENPDQVIEVLNSLLRGIKSKHLYRGREFQLKSVMTGLNNVCRTLGLFSFNKEVLKEEDKRTYFYNIVYSPNVLNIIGYLLFQDHEMKFNEERIKEVQNHLTDDVSDKLNILNGKMVNNVIKNWIEMNTTNLIED